MSDKRFSESELRFERLRRAAYNDFETFCKYLMPVIEPAILSGHRKLIWGEHHSALCFHLQAITEGKINTLGISVPPGSSKTSIASILWPIWMWLRNPSHSTIHVCVSEQLANEINDKKRNVIKSDRFQKLFKPDWHLTDDTKRLFKNSKQGASIAFGVRSTAIGNHADTIIVDDPCDPNDAKLGNSHKHVTYYHETLDQRRKRGQPHKTIVIMQRLAPDDLIGDLVKRDYFDVYLSLPCEYDPDLDPGTNKLGWKDWRKHLGEPLNALMYPAEDRAKKKESKYTWETQFQQRPTSVHGQLFDPDWWVRYYPKDIEGKSGPWVGAWDLTFGATGTDNDYAVGQVWFIDKADAYLVAQYRGRVDFPTQIKAMEKLAREYPQVGRWFVENRAGGKPAIDTLKRKVRGLIPWSSPNAKDYRIASTTGYLESGNVFVPHGSVGNSIIEEATAYPHGHDDQVDCMAIALLASGRVGHNVRQTVGSGSRRRKWDPKNAGGGYVPGISR